MTASIAGAVIGILASASDGLGASAIHEQMRERKATAATVEHVRAALTDLQRRGLVIRIDDDRYRLRAAAAHRALTSDVLLGNDVPAGIPVPETPEVES